MMVEVSQCYIINFNFIVILIQNLGKTPVNSNLIRRNNKETTFEFL